MNLKTLFYKVVFGNRKIYLDVAFHYNTPTFDFTSLSKEDLNSLAVVDCLDKHLKSCGITVTKLYQEDAVSIGEKLKVCLKLKRNSHLYFSYSLNSDIERYGSGITFYHTDKNKAQEFIFKSALWHIKNKKSSDYTEIKERNYILLNRLPGANLLVEENTDEKDTNIIAKRLAKMIHKNLK